jgi:uncharacterized protein
MQIIVPSSGRVIASDVKWARSFRDRTTGLIGVNEVPAGFGMVFEPAHQIHTFGMRVALDVVFCDRRWAVVHVVRHMAPRRITRPVWRSRFVVELAAGSLPAEVTVGQRLKLVG